LAFSRDSRPLSTPKQGFEIPKNLTQETLVDSNPDRRVHRDEEDLDRMTPLELQNNEHGTAKLCPITRFEVRLASNQMVVLVIQFVETIEQFDSGQCKQLQTVLTVNQALALAATLEKAASLYLESNSDLRLN
jgi:hypothetical protein